MALQQRLPRAGLHLTIIFGAAVFYEVFYWYLSVLALGLLAVVEREPVESSVLGHTGVSVSSALAPYPAAENVGGPGRTQSRLYPILQE